MYVVGTQKKLGLFFQHINGKKQISNVVETCVYPNTFIQKLELFAHCKGGKLNIHIWAWLGYFIC